MITMSDGTTLPVPDDVAMRMFSKNRVLAAMCGIAPRMLGAWQAMSAVVADGECHGYAELCDAAIATGVVEDTARNLLDDARRAGLLVRVSGRGRGQVLRSPVEDEAVKGSLR